MSLATYEAKVSRLIVNVRDGRASPHKICMLLAVLDLARGGGLSENRIFFAPPLLERYTRFFNAVRWASCGGRSCARSTMPRGSTTGVRKSKRRA